MLLYNLIIYPLYTIIEIIYAISKKFFHNEGLAVICVSIGITILCLPLYAVAEHWQEVEREKQAKMKSGLDRIKKAFSGDERYMMTSTFYRQHHYSPIMALRSSFGLLIQVPFFLAAYSYLSHLSDLNGESFLFIRNMGAPDALFSIGAFSVNILPIAMTLINCISGAIYSKGHGLREKLQIYIMAAVFLVVLYDSPAGLVLYWTFNNIFSLVKNIFYKLKNPLKKFWILCCAICVIFLAYILFGLKIKFSYTLVAMLAFACIFLAPVFIRFANKLIGGPLKVLAESTKTRNSLYILSCVLLFVLAGLSIPAALISSSPIEFSGLGEHPNPLFYIKTVLTQSAGFFLFWPLCVYFLFNKKIQTLLSAFMCWIAASAIVNSFFFMLNYGDVSATLTFLNAVNFRTISMPSLLNLFVLAALLLAIVFTIPFKKAKIHCSLVSLLIFAVTALALINTTTIQKQYKEFLQISGTESAKIEPIFKLSKNKQNVIVFMLDRSENQYAEEMFKEDPSFNESFSGFTLYKNTLSFNGHTLMGAPLVYGGYEYAPLEMNKRKDELLYKKNNEALLLLPRIFTEQADFSATITDPSWANYNAYADLTITDPYPKISGYQTIGKYSSAWYKSHRESSGLDNTEKLLKRNMLFFSFFRTSPAIVREIIYQQGKYWNTDDNVTSYTNIIDNYAPLSFLPQLTQTEETNSGSYICIVNELTHSSTFMQAPDYVPSEKITNKGQSRFKNEEAYHTNMAAFKQIAKWLDYLKQQGVYDNTRIIIAADHSRASYEDCMEKDDALDEKIAGDRYTGRGHFHPLLMVKDFNQTGPLKTDGTFMTNGDVPSIALNGIVEAPVNPFTNKKIPLDTTSIKKDGVIISSSDVHQAWLMQGDYTFPVRKNQWWRVKDDVFKASSWTEANIEN